MPKKIYASFVITCLCLISSSAVWAKSGGYLNLEASGTTIATSTEFDYDWGPGFNARLGYDWGIIGLRGSFFYAFMEHEHKITTGDGKDVHVFGGLVDLKVRPIGFIDIFFQPYAAVGGGALFVDSDPDYYLSDDPAPVLHAAVGVDLNITEHFGLVVEGEWKPTLMSVDTGIIDSNNTDEWIHLVSISGGVRILF